MRRVEGRPQVVAHRGSSHEKPEHTLAAYVAALDTGAEGLECDVRLTSDGHLVCVHDRRVDRTTNGQGAVSVKELAELDQLDFASWKLAEEAPEIDDEHRKVLTLHRLLEVVRDYDRPVDLAIETKHPTRYAGLVERRLVDLLARFGLTGAGSPVRVMSFSPVALTRVQRLAPALDVVLLIDRSLSRPATAGLLRPDWIAGPGIDLLKESPRLGHRLRRRGRRMHVWTANTAEELDLCLSVGAEAVITDDPRAALDHLNGPASGRVGSG